MKCWTRFIAALKLSPQFTRRGRYLVQEALKKHCGKRAAGSCRVHDWSRPKTGRRFGDFLF
jgi:hypothetical protein